MNSEKGKYLIFAKFRCRLDTPPTGMKEQAIKEQITRGQAKCPIEGKEVEMYVKHPAFNVAGPEVIKACPEPCSLCRKKPTISDVYIN